MGTRSRLVWKLSIPAVITVAVIILGAGIVGGHLSRQFTLESAGTLLEFNSASLRGAIDKLMMSRNKSGVGELLKDVLEEDDVYRDISLVSHPDGKVVASGIIPAGTHLPPEDRACQLCHIGDEPPSVKDKAVNSITLEPGGGRILGVVTPILNKPSCQTANCHIHANSPPVLGFLKTEYSLAPIDKLQATLTSFMVGAALLAVLLATGILFSVFRRVVDRPLRGLVDGLGRLSGSDMAFRFRSHREDEIGLVEESFDRMASTIEAEQEKLRETSEYLESIVENSADLIVTVSPDGLIRTFNRGAEQALGYNRDEVIGQPVEMLFEDPRERALAIVQLQETDNLTNYSTRFRTKAGECRDVLLTLSRLRDREGNSIGTLGISKDVTVENDLQSQLRQSEQTAAVGRAVTGAQRVVLSMLATIRRGLYVIRLGRKNGDSELTDEGYDLIEGGLARITDLSRNMLQYSHDWKIERSATDPHELAARITTVVKQKAEAQGVIFRTEVNPSLATISCDPRLVHMVLMDIVLNALDACEEKRYPEGVRPEVVLRLSGPSSKGTLTIEVQDNGIGMRKEIQDSAFTPFFTTKQTQEGTGLGLALALRIIEMHGGTISVESEPDTGSTFQISLPIDSHETDPNPTIFRSRHDKDSQ